MNVPYVIAMDKEIILQNMEPIFAITVIMIILTKLNIYHGIINNTNWIKRNEIATPVYIVVTLPHMK
jgi:hypothetical protein